MPVKQVTCQEGNLSHVASRISYVLRVKILHLANQIFYMLLVKYFMLLVNHVMCQTSRSCHVLLATHIAHTLVKHITHCQSNMLYFCWSVVLHVKSQTHHISLITNVTCCCWNTSHVACLKHQNLIISRHHNSPIKHDTCCWSKFDKLQMNLISSRYSSTPHSSSRTYYMSL